MENQNQSNNEKNIEIKPIKEQKKIHGELFVAVATFLLFLEAFLFIFVTISPKVCNYVYSKNGSDLRQRPFSERLRGQMLKHSRALLEARCLCRRKQSY